MKYDEIIHRRAIMAAIALVIGTVILVGAIQLSGGVEGYAPETPVIATADLLFEDEDDGVVAVFDATTGVRLIEYGVDEGVFVRGIMRSVARQRRMRGAGSETPVRLTHHSDGKLWLTDEVSGAQFYLGAFGPANTAAFFEILAIEEQDLSAQVQETLP
jgi:putative photosynthetic complex assembly protein